MAIKSQIRRGTAAQWSAANTVLSNGEWGLETDTKKIKIGDGITPWSSLAYITDETYANAITYAASVANQAYTNSVNYVANGVANGSIVVANAVYASNAGSLGGSSLSTIQGQITGNSATAYSNSVVYIDAAANSIVNRISNGTIVSMSANTAAYLANSTGTLSNIQSWITGNSATAYTNAVSFANSAANAAYINAISYANSAAASAYSNAVSFANSVANNAYSNAVSYANSLATTAYSNAVSVANSLATTAYSNAVSVANSLATTAYSNAVSFANSVANAAYTNAVSFANSVANAAYTNATVFASNASNINTGTLAEARLPYRMSQNVTSNSSVEFVNVYLTGNLTVGSNVNIIGANNYSVTDNMIYLNANATYANPDIGFTAGYNDGTYAHTGFFRDHTSGIWKVFDGYLPEPDASIYIDQSNSSFSTAGFMANVVYVGNNTVYGTVNSTAFSGTANNATNFDGLSLTTVQGQITGNAATAYSNSVAYTNITANAITNSVSNGTLVAFTANNSNNLGGVPAASYVNTSGSYTITGVHTYNANLVVNAAMTTGNTVINGTVNIVAPNTSAAAWTTSGIGLVQTPTTWTDTTSTGAVPNVYMNMFGQQTLAAANPIVTTLFGSYFRNPIFGANATGTLYALGADTVYCNGTLTTQAITATSGAMNIGNATGSQTLQFGYGATASGNTKTINIGTAGLSGSITNITLGSNVSGANSNVNVNGTTFVNGVFTVANSTSNVAVFAANGNVGIGTNTSNLTDTFVVNGRARIDGTNRLTFGFAQGGYAGIGILGNTTGTMLFSTYDGSALQERMRISYDTGNVGIGTASPAYRLDTAGTTRSYGLISNQIGVPATPTGTANNTSGSLAAATYYFKIVAVGGMGSLSLPSAEANTTVTGGTSSIVINWAATPGASSYRIYYSTAAGSQGAYYTSTTNTFTLTATSGTAGSPPSVDSTGQVLVGNTTTSVTVGGAIPLINLNPSSTNSISIAAQSNTTLALSGSSTGQMLVLTDTTSNTLFMVANSSGATLLAARANNNIDLNPYVGNTTVGLYSNTPILSVGPGTSNSTVIIGGAAYNYINAYTTATTSIVLDTFNANTYSTVDYVIQAFANNNYQTSTLRVVANSTVVFSTEIGRVFTGANSIAEYTTTVSGGVVSVNTIPVISGTTFKIIKTMIGA